MLPILNDKTEMTAHLWRELSDKLRQFVRSRINNSADVDDIVQNVFLRIHTHIAQLRDVDRLESWIYQITRNALADYFSQRRRIPSATTMVPEPITDHDDDTSNLDITGCLQTFIKQLPADQQRAIAMYEIDGLSQKEIAQKEIISEAGAKSRIQRGRKKLAELLQACCQFHVDSRGNIIDYTSKQKDCRSDKCK